MNVLMSVFVMPERRIVGVATKDASVEVLCRRRETGGEDRE